MESSLPSRPPPSASPMDPSPQPSITRPYKLSPPASPSALKPSALLQRRSKAKQGLYPVDAPATGSTSADGIDPSPTPPSPEVEQQQQRLPSAADRKPPSAYEILQVLPSASQQEIKSSFLALARQHHPDKAPAERKEASSLLFLQIHSAYDTLRDPQSRARHDRDLFVQSSRVFATTNVRKPVYCSPSPRIFATHSFTPRTTATAYTTTQSPMYTPRSSGAATPSFTPRTPYSGSTWETDQYS